MIRLIFSLAVLVFAVMATPIVAQDKAPKTKSFKVMLKELPPDIRRVWMKALADQHGVEAPPASRAASSTKNCPSSCNNSSGGGYCYCDPDENGNCPSGTSKGGSPGSEYCKVKMPKGAVTIPGGKEYPVVLTPYY